MVERLEKVILEVGKLILKVGTIIIWASLVAQTVKNLPAMQEIEVQSLDWEDPLEKGTANYLLQYAAAAKSLQSCPTLCDPMDSSPPGSSVHRIL